MRSVRKGASNGTSASEAMPDDRSRSQKSNSRNPSVIRLDDQLCYAVYAASRAMTMAYREILKSSDLTYPQYIVMVALWEQDGVTISDLCQRVLLDFGTVTPLLKRLETRGILSRTRDPEDERIIRLGVTDAGWTLHKKAVEAPQKLRCKISLSREETARVRLAMKTLIQDLKGTG